MWLKVTVSLESFRNQPVYILVICQKAPGTEEPGDLPSVGLHRVGHD